MDIREIQNLIKFVAKSGATEVKLEMDDFKITIKTTEAGAAEASYFQHYPSGQPMQQMVQQQQVLLSQHLLIVKLPLLHAQSVRCQRLLLCDHVNVSRATTHRHHELRSYERSSTQQLHRRQLLQSRRSL